MEFPPSADLDHDGYIRSREDEERAREEQRAQDACLKSGGHLFRRYFGGMTICRRCGYEE